MNKKFPQRSFAGLSSDRKTFPQKRLHQYPAEHCVRRHYGIRTERYSLMHFYNDIDEWELFDLKKDS